MPPNFLEAFVLYDCSQLAPLFKKLTSCATGYRATKVFSGKSKKITKPRKNPLRILRVSVETFFCHGNTCLPARQAEKKMEKIKYEYPLIQIDKCGFRKQELKLKTAESMSVT